MEHWVVIDAVSGNRPQTVRASDTGYRLAAIVAVSLCIWACSRAPDDPHPRLVLVYATCTLNRSYLEPYNRSVSFTPHLSEFARQSVVFRRHESESGQSGTSFASIFSGTQAQTHRIYFHPNRLPDELYLITEAFADAGYEPWFWSGHLMASWDLNYAQGVESQRVAHGERSQIPGKRAFLQPGDPQFQAMLAKLKEDPDYRAFALVCFTVTHGPYHKNLDEALYEKFIQQFPAEASSVSATDFREFWPIYENNRRLLEQDFPTTVKRLGLTSSQVADLAQVLEVTYKANVHALDGMFGRTLQMLDREGLLDESLIAFTADHGEVLYRENSLMQWTHGLQLAPEVLSVPWLIRSPMHALRPGDYKQVTRSIDLYPTVAGLCGIDVSNRGIEGIDLSPALRGETSPPKLLAYSHSTVLPPVPHYQEKGRSRWLISRFFPRLFDVNQIWVRIRDGDLACKLRNVDGRRWAVQAYDLQRDPGETEDLFDLADVRHAEMRTALRSYKKMLVRNFVNASTESLPDDETLKRLKALGYVGGSDDAGHDAASGH